MSLPMGSLKIHDFITFAELCLDVPAPLRVLGQLVSIGKYCIMGHLVADVHVFQVQFHSIRTRSFPSFESSDRSSTENLGRRAFDPFEGRVVDGILCSLQVVNPVGLILRDKGSEYLAYTFDGSFCTAVGLLVECCRGQELDSKSLVHGTEVVGNKLRTPIRNDTLG